MRYQRLFSLAALCVMGGLAACVPPHRLGIDVVYVDRAPPPRRVEVIPARPGPEFVWIEGHWAWASRDYEWSPGRWERPPRRHAHWVQGRWHKHGHEWYWEPGHWK
jgi:WXXGXW repeat (2 copies)